MRSKIISFALCGLIGISAISCAAAAPRVKAQEEPLLIKDISVRDYPERTEIVVVGERPLTYTTFRLTDPDRLIVDLAGTTFGPFRKKLEVNKGALKNILPIEGEKPSYIARLEMTLTEMVESQVRTEGNTLIVALEKPTAVAEGAGVAPIPPVPLPAIEEQPLPPLKEQVPLAKIISNVMVEPTEREITVTISGDGELKPQVTMMEGNRLVVDLPEVTNAVTPNVMVVKHPVLKKVRIGQHLEPKKVRVVLDLTRPVPYEVLAADRAVSLKLQTIVEPPPTTALAPEVTPPPEKIRPAVSPAPAVNAREPQEVAPPKKYTGRKISLDFQDADLDDVLRLLADVSGLNIVIGPDVKGKVTIKLINVPWDQALEIILKMNNLGQIREGNIIRIATLSSIAKQEAEEAAAKEAKVKAEDLVTRMLPINYAKAEELAESLRKNLSPRGDITIDKRTNTMIIKDVEKHLQEILNLAKALDTQTRQIQIEARIVAADTTFARDLGVMWAGTFQTVTGSNVIGVTGGPGVFSAATGTSVPSPPLSPTPGFAVNLPATGLVGTVGGIGFTFGRFTDKPINLDLRLSAGEKMGLSKTISAPKISVLDNQEARIEQGTSIPFQTTSLQGTQTTFVDANLILQVTPHVTTDGNILMKVKVANNEPDFANQTPAGPPIKKKEATTQLLVKDGDTTVIGGIYISTKSDTTVGIPLLSKIPILGWLFKQRSKSDTTNELLLFLTPRIIR